MNRRGQRLGVALAGPAVLAAACGEPSTQDDVGGSDTVATSGASSSGGSGVGTTGFPVDGMCEVNESIFGQPLELDACPWPDAGVLCPSKGATFPDRVVSHVADPGGSDYAVVDFEADGVLELVALRADGNNHIVSDVLTDPVAVPFEQPQGARRAVMYDVDLDDIDDVVFLTLEGLVPHRGGQPPLSLLPRIDLAPAEGKSAAQAELLVGELNGNGTDDLVVAWGGWAETVVLDVVLDGSTVVASQVFDLERGEWWSAAIGDVDGDGLDDVVAGPLRDPGPAALVVLRNTGDGAFEQGSTLQSPPESGLYVGPPALADFDGDGRDEIVIAPLYGYGAAEFDVWNLEGDAWSASHRIGPLLTMAEPLVGDSPIPVASPFPVDLDEDGDLDLLLAAHFFGKVCDGQHELWLPTAYVLRNDAGKLQPAGAYSLVELGHPYALDYAPRLLPSGDLFVFLELGFLDNDSEEIQGALVYEHGDFLPDGP